MMRPVTIGTAGHIDHGKSALVRALTGIDPDRLAEEQRRGMTLDLGFAHVDLPSGARIGIIDVPGHEALIHNMLAGAGGIDLVMLVVAADEGVMPQTREHLDILRFLPLAGGVVVLTKVDLVPDPEWMAVVRDDVQALVAGTVLDGAPIVPVSAKTGEGLADLVAILDRLVAGVPERDASGPVRLPVDRSFTMQGFGTVVTGTLWSGTIRPGDLLVILPQGREVRVRGVQVHGHSVSQAAAGSRVAANLVGVEKEDVSRGDALVTVGAFRPTDRLDVRLRLLPGAPLLRHSARVHLHLGSGETVGRAVLVDRPRLEPGEEVLAQLRLERPVVAVHGDRFVLRRYSPTQTIGGGMVLNASPPGRRHGARAAAVLEAVERSGPTPLIVAAVADRGRSGMSATAAASAAGLDAGEAGRALSAAREAGLIVAIGDRLYAGEVVAGLRADIEEALAGYHRRIPWRRGMPREELKSRTLAGGDDRLFDAVISDLVHQGRIVEHGPLLAHSAHEPVLTETDRRLRAALLRALEQAGVSPPSLDDLRRLGEPGAVDRILQALIDDGDIVQAAPELRFAAKTLEEVRRTVVRMLREGAEVTVATLRDRLGTSRKYALAVLEYLDASRVTRRVGDRRVLGPQADDPVLPRR
ncbi:MAG: selenocysteine-specific translation elongation factor [Armatimonadetes bacterium]|nr:selenocysteine-specific translation elongation factor [Armatimonadota bacterium]